VTAKPKVRAMHPVAKMSIRCRAMPPFLLRRINQKFTL
jgi:hypothetical protein